MRALGINATRCQISLHKAICSFDMMPALPAWMSSTGLKSPLCQVVLGCMDLLQSLMSTQHGKFMCLWTICLILNDYHEVCCVGQTA